MECCYEVVFKYNHSASMFQNGVPDRVLWVVARVLLYGW